MIRDALLGFLQLAFAQVRAGFEVGLVDLVEEDVAPGEIFRIQQFVPAFKFGKHAGHSAESDGMRGECFVAVVFWIERRID